MEKKISPNLTLFALAINAFAIGSTEFISVGLLPMIVKSFHISLSQAGLTVSLYALGVTIGAPLLTILTGKWNRRSLMLGIMLLFISGNLIAAFAPTFIILLVGRILSALAHGIFMSVSTVIAADVVPPSRRASAVYRLNGCNSDWRTFRDVYWATNSLAYVLSFYSQYWLGGTDC